MSYGDALDHGPVLRYAGINARSPCWTPVDLATVTAAEADLKIRLERNLTTFVFFGVFRHK